MSFSEFVYSAPDFSSLFSFLCTGKSLDQLRQLKENELQHYLQIMNLDDAQHILNLKARPTNIEEILEAVNHRREVLLQYLIEIRKIFVQAGIYQLKKECGSRSVNNGKPIEIPLYMQNPEAVLQFCECQSYFLEHIEWAKITVAKSKLWNDLRERQKVAGQLPNCLPTEPLG